MSIDSSESPASVFVSHTGSDDGLADAIQFAIEGLCPGKIRVCHSSRKDGVGGVPTGANWLNWIGGQVRDADVTFVLLTPTSLTKSWLLWETGAVYGAAFAAGAEKDRSLWPLLYRMQAEDLPGPLRAMNRQARRGDSAAQFGQVVEDLLDYLSERGKLNARDQRAAAGCIKTTLEQYMSAVNKALRTSPILPTEPVIQEWCARLDDLLHSGRASEVDHLRDWLDIAFGRDDKDRLRPLDARIHRRLGQLYVSGKRYTQAAEQFRLTWELAPRDIFVLRTLGEAALKASDLEEADRCLQEIERLDVDAISRNADCAALKGGYLQATDRQEEACRVYETALGNMENSYYLRDLLGQVQLELEHVGDARESYRKTLEVLAHTGERTMWAHATAATAGLVTGDPSGVTNHLEAVASFKPSADNVQAIERALISMNDRLPTNERVSRDLLRVPKAAASQPQAFG